MLSHPISFASEHLTPRPGSCAMYTCTFELPNSIPDRHENVFENISGDAPPLGNINSIGPDPPESK